MRDNSRITHIVIDREIVAYTWNGGIGIASQWLRDYFECVSVSASNTNEIHTVWSSIRLACYQYVFEHGGVIEIYDERGRTTIDADRALDLLQESTLIEDEKPPAKSPIVFLDVESQKSAQEVGGWRPELMLFGLAVTHDDVHGYRVWYEKDIAVLVDLLLSSDQVVGYNLIDFDFKLIAAYDRRIDQVTSKAVDLLTRISSALGFRLKLDDVARATLGKGKTGDGMLSLSLWKEGRFAEVEAYCRMDVELTKELHAHALQHGKLRYPAYGQIREVTIDLRPVD